MTKDILSYEEKRKLPTHEQLLQLRPQMKSSNGRRVLRSLFVETAINEVMELGVVEPVFTIKDDNFVKNGKFYWSLKNIYFSYDHIPGYEYQFAMDVFGDWNHWVLLCETSNGVVSELIKSWRDELTIRIQAKAMEAMILTATCDGSKGTPAAKFLADRGWEVKRGRPSKDEIEREKKIQSGVNREIEEDMARLGISVLSGGKE